MNNTLKLALRAAAIVVVALLSTSYLGAPWDQQTPVPSTRPASPTPMPLVAAQAAPQVMVPEPGAVLEPGRYLMLGPSSGVAPAGWPQAVTVDIPGGWTQVPPTRGSGLSMDPLAKLEFGSVGDFAADACDAPPVGPGVDDLVAALSSVEGLETTAPTAVTLAGFHGKRVEVTHLAGYRGCEGSRTLWWTLNDQRNEVWDVISIEGWQHWLWVLDVNGLRFLVHASFAPDAPSDLQAQLLSMVNTVQIDP